MQKVESPFEYYITKTGELLNNGKNFIQVPKYLVTDNIIVFFVFLNNHDYILFYFRHVNFYQNAIFPVV